MNFLQSPPLPLRPDEITDPMEQYRARFSTFDTVVGADISRPDRLGTFVVESFTADTMPPAEEYPLPSIKQAAAQMVAA